MFEGSFSVAAIAFAKKVSEHPSIVEVGAKKNFGGRRAPVLCKRLFAESLARCVADGWAIAGLEGISGAVT